MKVKRIFSPAKGERVIAVNPEMKPEIGADWRRRLNFYTGRSLSDVALTTEQAGRDGRLAMRGQMMSPGVITGLEAALELDPDGNYFYHLLGGAGMAASGEDFVMTQGMRVNVRSTLVYLPPGLTGLGDHLSLESTLGELIDDGIDLPRAGVLVLQPVTAALIGRLDPGDECEIDPANDAYDDWQLADACRLVFYAWPTTRIALPASTPAATWRNRLAHTIFEAEKAKAEDELMPWNELGVPVGLVGFADDWTPLFLDRYAVVRAGGKPQRRRTIRIYSPIGNWRAGETYEIGDVVIYSGLAYRALQDHTSFGSATPLGTPALWQLAGSGNPFLWQARVQQFTDQISGATLDNVPFADLRREYRYLPPAGLLPREVLNPREGQTEDLFFPTDYVVDAVPIPIEQLDAAIEGSAALDPFDLGVPDRVRVLVPVPQVWYEPALLQLEEINPEFQEAIDEFVTRRGRWLNRRGFVREIISLLTKATTGTALTFPSPDPNALETPEALFDPIDENDPQLKDPEGEYGTAVNAAGERQIALIEELRAYLLTSTPLRSVARVAFPVDVENDVIPGLRYEKTVEGLGFLIFSGIMDETTREKLRDFLFSRDVGAEVVDAAVEGLYSQSQRNEVAQLDRLGLIKFIEYLKAKLQAADDRIDLGFLQAQTNIYRLRQIMLGTAAASRLATSTALAEIAQGDTAVATREQLNEYVTTLRSAKAGTPAAGTLKGAVAAASAAPSSATKAGVSTAVTGISAPISELHSTASKPIVESGLRADFTSSISDELNLLKTESETVQLTSRVSSKLIQPAAPQINPIEAITDQSYIVGKTFDFRTVTVAERLTNPPPNETKVASSANKFEVIKNLTALDLNLDDVQVPGLALLNADGQPVYNDENGRPVRQTKKLIDMTDLDFAFILNDPDPRNAAEADFFSAAVDVSEHAINTLRQIEGRVRSYRLAVARCEDTLKKLQAVTGDADRRLKVIGDEVAEARHDVSVARALFVEETARIQRINDRRTLILQEHVPYLAYYRPRLSNVLTSAPHRPVNPGLVAAPLPTCLSRAVTIPADLRAMVDLFSDVPLKWLKYVLPLLDRLNSVNLLQETLVSAKTHAQVKLASPAKTLTAATTSALGLSINKTFAAQQAVVTQYRAQTAQLNLASLVNLGWKSTRDSAIGNLSLGDLRDAPHGRSDVISEATAELNNIAHVAGCLYESFGAVLPRIRLEWAERLSQYDEEVSLRNLANLPRWGEIDYLDRREMQGLVDWLYSRVDANEAQAIAMCDDLVRVAILLASHAPVNEIIAGSVQEAATVKPGSSLKLNVDLTKVKIGMGVFVYKGADVVAHAVVEDLSAGLASAKITKTYAPTVQLEKNAAVQFTNQPALMSAFGMQGKK